MKTGRIGFFPFMLVGGWLLMSCTAPPVGPEQRDLPLKPPSVSPSQDLPEQTGRQSASIQLTEEGRELLRAGRLEEAMSKFQKAISLYPSNPYAYYYFGEARYLRQEHHQSLTLLERAGLLFMSDSGWLSKVHVLRGKNYEGLSRYDEAQGQYQQALAEDPRNAEAREGMLRVRESTLSP